MSLLVEVCRDRLADATDNLTLSSMILAAMFTEPTTYVMRTDGTKHTWHEPDVRIQIHTSAHLLYCPN